MANDDNPSLFANDVTVILIAMGSAAFIVTMYHLLALCLCTHQFTHPNSDQPPPRRNILLTGTPSISETSVARLIPAHKYKKKVLHDDVAGGDHENNNNHEDATTCAVCLGDFEDGEELRTLPECAHSFHVSCIDMWLYSHPNCPVCRADATPSPALQSNANDHRIHIVQNALVYNGLVRR